VPQDAAGEGSRGEEHQRDDRRYFPTWDKIRTIINTLAGRVVPRPVIGGVTKTASAFNLGSGVGATRYARILWPKIEKPQQQLSSGATGAIKNTAMEYDDVSFFVAEYLIKCLPPN